ncbi:MAG: hypothetical protein GYB31_15395 [Bacteroidetes bacterium]|nr:hypothetical protein [Bacteroidota bacterium]
MIITNEITLREVKSAFTDKFHYLKLEFYTRPHEPGKGSPAQEVLDDSLLIKEVRKTGTSGDLEIIPDMKVRDLESRFAEDYGLYAQVFRRSGNIWMQTSVTDEWTLEKQNRKGGSSEKSFQSMHEND